MGKNNIIFGNITYLFCTFVWALLFREMNKKYDQIIARTIPHKDQKYETVGNYFIEDNRLIFEISDMNNKFYERLVLIHELIEHTLLEFRGVDIKYIDAFDINFENNRKEDDLSEPGFEPDAPYVREHTLATSVEMSMCALAGVSWKKYDKTVMEL